MYGPDTETVSFVKELMQFCNENKSYIQYPDLLLDLPRFRSVADAPRCQDEPR